MFCPGESTQLNTGWWAGHPELIDPLTSYGTIQINWHPGSDGIATEVAVFNADGSLKPSAPAGWQTRALSLNPKPPASIGVFGHMYTGQGPYLNIMYLHANPAWTGNRFSYDLANNHNQALPVAFLDGHVDIIDIRNMEDPTRYGPTGSTPLWKYFGP